jgi:hypothetical protein
MEACYHLIPSGGGNFDMQKIEQQLLADPAIFRHPTSTQLTYIVCADASIVPYVHRRLLTDPTEPYDTQGVIILRPEYITVYQSVPQEILDRIAKFVIPLIRDLNCNIVNEFGDDITDRYRGQFDKLFGE